MNKIIAFIVLVLCPGLAFAAGDGYEVKGVISDSVGPVVGAAVVEKGTSNGTSTGIDGDYILIVSSADAVVEVSCIGYTTITFKASDMPGTIQMKEDAVFLDDVVVIGYGSQKKKEVTGSVASVKSEDFNAGVKSNPIGLLQGKVAGLNIIRTTSDPTNTSYNIQIRGFSTLDKGAGTSPLFIVDGVPVSSIDNISTDEIASMDVLKDGSAAAIYGTRGTNGVIIITTKRGENFSDIANTKVEYSGYVSASMKNSKTGLATPEQFVNINSLSNGAMSSVVRRDGDGNYVLTDWLGEITRKAAITHSHNVAVTGSSKKFNYRASVNFKNAEGIAKKNNRQEILAKIAASQKALNGWLELQYDLSYMHYRNDYNCADWKMAAVLNPTYPIYDPARPNGYFKPEGTGEGNPVEQMNQKESYQEGNYFRGSVKASVNIKPVPGLKVSGFAALEEGDNHSYWFNKTINTDEAGSGKAGREMHTNLNKLFEATIDYSHSWGRHNLAAVAGFSYQNFFNDGENMSNKGFPTEDMKYYQIGNGDASKDYLTVGSYRNSNTLAALFLRANYNYADRYLVSASVRREGSSRFGANNKWGWFPAVSLGWRICSEEFMQDEEWCNDLKLRLGFGVTGNNLASDLRSVAMLSNGGTFWDGAAGKYVYTYAVSQNVNPDLRWEKKYEYNLGLDFAFLDNRLYGSLDLYYRQTRDLLWDYEVPTPPYQFPTLLANAGQMDSYGVELVISGVPVKTKDWTWVTTPTISFNRNYITKLSDPSKGFNYDVTECGEVNDNGVMNVKTQILKEGHPVGSFYGYKFYDFRPRDGEWMYETPTGGYISSPNAVESYKQVIGSAQPWFTYGWNNTIRWKDLDISIFFRGVVGNKILNVARWIYGPQSQTSVNFFAKDCIGDNVRYANKANFSDYYLENGSYFKLDNITVGYTFRFKENKYIDHLRLYLTGQNLFTITSYSGPDPEVNTTSVWNSGIDYPSFYPRVATVLLGLNISLF